MHSSVCLESATALAEPNSRPARRWAQDKQRHDHQRYGGQRDADRGVLGRFCADQGVNRFDGYIAGQREKRQTVSKTTVTLEKPSELPSVVSICRVFSWPRRARSLAVAASFIRAWANW